MKKKQSPQFGFAEILFMAACAVALMVLQTVLCYIAPGNAAASAVLLCAVYVAAVCAFAVIRHSKKASKAGSEPLPQAVRVLAGAVVSLPYPAVILPEDRDVIIWANRAAGAYCNIKKDLTFSSVFRSADSGEGSVSDTAAGSPLLSAGDHLFSPASYTSEGQDGKLYRVIILDDVTEREAERRTLLGREGAVAYIVVDNLEELLNYEQEDYRSASGETERILRLWASDAGGVLKEYQQDKYIFIFEKSHLDGFMRSGFDVLDKIRNIRVGETNIPVTVSIGICAVGQTFTEKEKNAQSALDTALQRGGDQVVVKGGGSLDIYGGKTKMPQKRTRVRARVVATELISRISVASNVLIMAHKYADFDAFGASVGLARLAMFCGVPVNIVSDLDDTNLDRCRSWLSDEKEYKSVFVDADAAMDLLRSDTLLIVTDVNNRNQYESTALFDHCGTVAIIDHHRKTADFAREPVITYIEPAASASSELVSEMLEQVLPGDELLPHEADLLMAGILLDTNQFTKNTGTRTFSAALYLRGRGADLSEVQEFFKTELDDFQREMKFHSHIEIYRGITAIATTDENCTVQDKIPAAKAADKLLSVEGVKASFAIVPIGNEVHISARSAGTINVQLLLEGLRGGGHYDSAGTRLEAVTSDEAAAMLKKAIDTYLDENAMERRSDK